MKTEEQMTLARLERILDAYGADPGRWPADERPCGEALLNSSPRAREIAAAARQTDRLLDAVPAPAEASGELKAAIMAAIRNTGPETRAARWRAVWRELMTEIGGWRPAGAALATSLMLGIVVGGLVNLEGPPESGVNVFQLAFLENNITEY